MWGGGKDIPPPPKKLLVETLGSPKKLDRCREERRLLLCRWWWWSSPPSPKNEAAVDIAPGERARERERARDRERELARRDFWLEREYRLLRFCLSLSDLWWWCEDLREMIDAVSSKRPISEGEWVAV